MARIKTVCDETWELFRGTPDVSLRERLHAVLLSRDGRTRSEIAEILYCPVEDVRSWLDHYREGGLASLKSSLHAKAATELEAPPVDPSVVAETAAAELPAGHDIPTLDVECGLSEEVQNKIRQCLRFSPRLYKLKSKVWTTRALAEVLQKDLNQQIPHQAIRAFLKNAGVCRVQSKEQFLEKRRSRQLESLNKQEAAALAAKQA